MEQRFTAALVELSMMIHNSNSRRFDICLDDVAKGQSPSVPHVSGIDGRGRVVQCQLNGTAGDVEVLPASREPDGEFVDGGEPGWMELSAHVDEAAVGGGRVHLGSADDAMQQVST